MKKNKIITLDEVLTIENLRSAHKSVMKICKNKKGKYNFNFNKNINIENIYRLLKNGEYKPLPYILFVIYEPKPRLVMSQSVNDKIVNHFISKNILIPNLEKKLCDNNIATRIGKGSSYGNKLMVKYINTLRQKGEVYCLKLDISKYFYNINHEILLNKLKKDKIDDKTLKIISRLIDETNNPYVNKYINDINYKNNLEIPIYKNGVGLSIGAVINQFLAIYYINDVIKFIKEKFHLLNPKSTICSLKSGINFLGVRHYELNGKYIRGFRKSTIKKVNKRLNDLKRSDLIKYNRSLASYHGYYSIINANEKGDFKMKHIDKYESYQKKYKDMLILLKEGSFYKCYNDDAIIMRYIFDYTFFNNSISFGTKAYSKVFDELNRIKISYVVISDEEYVNKFDNDIYNVYLKLAKDNYEEENLINEINEKVKLLINKDKNNHKIILDYLNEIE